MQQLNQSMVAVTGAWRLRAWWQPGSWRLWPWWLCAWRWLQVNGILASCGNGRGIFARENCFTGHSGRGNNW